MSVRTLPYLLILLALICRSAPAQVPGGEANGGIEDRAASISERSANPATNEPTNSDSLPLGPRQPRTIQSERTKVWDQLPSGTLRTLGALGVVFVLLLMLRALVRRLGGPLAGGRSPSGVMEVLGRFPFARGQSLVLLKLDRRILLLCQTSQGAQTLTELTDPDEVASLLRAVHEHEGSSFNARLEELLQEDGRAGASRRGAARDGQTTITPTVRSEIIDLTRSPTAPASELEVNV